MSASTAMPPPRCDEEVLTITVGSYSEATKLANGSCVKSTPIDVGGHSWRVAFYPNGRPGGTTGFMSLYLLMNVAEGGRAAAGEDVHVKFSLMMRDVGGGARFLTSGKVAAAFSRKWNAYGFERFVSREHFADFFKSDRFVIRCGLTVFPAGSQPEPAVEAAPEPPILRARAPLSSLHADLRRLLATKEGADVEFEVEGKVFAAHKSVLAARSSVFKEEFCGPTKEKDTS
ncbi:BTB/POZ and MATH domain-containing protein 2-like [Panicum hallii]|jgi:speckle-type POZ protein|uniref:BTB/POZ and MATH domain-containing protein 2-like n=1 Tax=Panicum hallii TaxID=206008 RepID=UPI000DF4DA10|nr:BTB/POZ and MATH domain-containing protein 2-like [Panicum hallii]